MSFYSRALFIFPFLILLFLCLLGTVGYSLIEGWSILDSLFMTIITLTTVGYQEVHPLSDAGMWFTIFLLFVGLGIFLYMLNTGTQRLLEGVGIYAKISKIRKMKSRINHLKDHYIICGFGRIGRNLTEEMIKKNLPFVVVDKSESNLAELEDMGENLNFYEGDASSEDVLKEVQIDKAQALITIVGEDAENVFITMTARQLVPGLRIISRYSMEKTRSKLKIAGASEFINPHKIGGERIFDMLLYPKHSQFFKRLMENQKLNPLIEEIEISDTSGLVGKTMAESKMRDLYNILILSLESASGEWFLTPDRNHRIQKGDKMLVMGTKDQVSLFFEKHSK